MLQRGIVYACELLPQPCAVEGTSASPARSCRACRRSKHGLSRRRETRPSSTRDIKPSKVQHVVGKT